MPHSPFLDIPSDEWILSNELSFAVFDRYPVSTGHMLVLTKRAVPTWFDASPAEQAAMMALVNQAKDFLDRTLQPTPSGYNVGFNTGEAAGQTVMHVHIHVIPRYTGDMPDPRGGVRHVIPWKGNYLKSESETLTLSTGHPNSRLWDELSHRMIGAKHVDILASFVQNSGLEVIEQRLFQLLRRDSTVRIMVSDYLSISDPPALKRLCDWMTLIEDDEDSQGTLQVRLVEMSKLKNSPTSFHPKSWRISDSRQSFIAVGSSNLSRPALETGIEWNLLSTTSQHLTAHDDFAREFNSLWSMSSPLSPEVVENYAKRATAFRKLHFEAESLDASYIPEPRPWQRSALSSLQRIRNAGYGRALVAVATGMGKTWLAALDVQQVRQQLNRSLRVIVIAHRSHILAQAESVLSSVLEDSSQVHRTSWYIGSRGDLSGDIVIASIQKLSRPEGLKQLAEERFDYAVIDEVHHAHAPTYRRVLAKLNATFVLGLTATPERGDGVDVAALFDDNLAHHASIGDGITEESLVPFHYVGIRDTVDFRQIAWRNGRFDTAELERRIERSERMNRLWKAMQEFPADRTIVFCSSRRHALFARDWLRSQGSSSAAVFSGEGGDGEIESLEALRTGKLQTLCVVDMFNEGLDIPEVDRVVMLRPTESKVVFLQQLGRGLRAAPGKTRLIVIDFVGNHRIFAQRMLHLLSLAGHVAGWTELRRWLGGDKPDLPPGCELDVEIEAKDLLSKLLPKGSQAALETYRALRDELGRRPRAAELFARNILPGTLSSAVGSWFEFIQSEGDMTTEETEVLQRDNSWFKTVETTRLNKSYKMVVLRSLLDHGRLFKPIDLAVFAKRCRRFMLEHSSLKRDLLEGKHALNHETAGDEEWAEWWRQWPIDRWLDTQNGHRWFSLKGDRLRLEVDCPDQLRGTFEAMTEELVEWRLAAYAKSHRLTELTSGDWEFEAKVSHSGGKAILFLPDKDKFPNRPIGPINVVVPDGTTWVFKFVKVACNVAGPVGEGEGNRLSDLLQSWFGAQAGQPGTDYKVLFESVNGRWHVRPSDAAQTSASRKIVEPETAKQPITIEKSVSLRAKFTTHVPVYDLVAAASEWGSVSSPDEVGWTRVEGRNLAQGMFVAKVVGRSMEPKIPSGSLCLFGPCPAGTRQNRLLLVQASTHLDPEDGGRYTVKQYRSKKRVTDEDWEHEAIELVPLNPEYQPIQISAEDSDQIRVIGEFLSVVG